MNKVITINLNGIAYQLEEDGFDALRAYLDTAARRLDGNPDKAEIIADIEQSIGDKFRALLGPNKSVVGTKEVEDVIADMGPVQDAAGAGDDAAHGGAPAGAPGAKGAPAESAAAGEAPGAAKKLYKIREGAMVGGVCNGLAAYFGIDVTIVRIAFCFTAFMWGSGVLLYLLMWIIIPSANTPAEMAAATGIPSTAEEFIRRARAGYYGGMRTFKDKKAYREWKWQFKREMRQNKREFQQEMHQNFRRWRQQWGQPPLAHGGSSMAASFLSLLITIVCVIGYCAIISLILTGSVLGFGLPAGMPLWLGVILLFLVFKVIKWPLKAARYSMWYPAGDGPGYWGAGHFFCGTFWWVAILLAAVWFMNHHSMRAHEALDQVRHGAHHAVDSLRNWWDSP